MGALVVSPQPGPPPLVSASRARFMAPVERGAQILTMVTLVMVSVSVLLTTVATPRLTLTGLPKDSAFVMASTTARGALTLLPTTPTAWSSPTTTTSTPFTGNHYATGLPGRSFAAVIHLGK